MDNELGRNKLTNHAAEKEQGLNKSNLILFFTKEPPLRHRRAVVTAGPCPRTRFMPTNSFLPGVTPRSEAVVLWFPVGKDHNHRVERLKRPCKACEHEMTQLPRPELAAVFV